MLRHNVSLYQIFEKSVSKSVAIHNVKLKLREIPHFRQICDLINLATLFREDMKGTLLFGVSQKFYLNPHITFEQKKKYCLRLSMVGIGVYIFCLNLYFIELVVFSVFILSC